MNVAFDPWIPVVTSSGERKLASLCSVMTEGENYADLAVRPHERVSLMRLFICVAHAALEGPKDYEAWKKVPEELPKKAKEYLEKWKDSFELFHATRPWLQVAKLKGDNTSPVALLDFELATGNNSTLNDHQGQLQKRNLTQERVALCMLTFQNFSSGGGSPIAQWDTTKTKQVGNPDAPCLSQSMAHCFMRGSSLIETIWFNLPTVERIKETYKVFSMENKEYAYKDVEMGLPVWEKFPISPDSHSDEVVNATNTYMGRLVPISRWIKLIEGSDQMYCCNGFKYQTHKEGFPSEPTASVKVVKKKDKKGVVTEERQVVKINPSRALWRELSALLVKRSAWGIGGPLAMENVQSVSEYDFLVCAMTRDQASMDIAIESVFHIKQSFQENLPSYQAEIEEAEALAARLGWAVESFRKEIDCDWENRVEKSKDKWELKAKLHSLATTHYWTTVEKNLSFLMAHIEAIGTGAAVPTREAWRKMLFSTACESYRLACGGETPRQIRAFVQGWKRLLSIKDEPKETIEENNREDEE